MIIVVHVLQIDTLLFKQAQHIAYKISIFSHMFVTEIETIDVRVSTHCKVLSYTLCLVCRMQYHQRKMKIEFRSASLGGTTSLLLENVKLPIFSIGASKLSSIDINTSKFSKYRYFNCCNDFERTRSRSVRRADFLTSLSIRVLPQFDRR